MYGKHGTQRRVVLALRSRHCLAHVRPTLRLQRRMSRMLSLVLSWVACVGAHSSRSACRAPAIDGARSGIPRFSHTQVTNLPQRSGRPGSDPPADRARSAERVDTTSTVDARRVPARGSRIRYVVNGLRVLGVLRRLARNARRLDPPVRLGETDLTCRGQLSSPRERVGVASTLAFRTCEAVVR